MARKKARTRRSWGRIREASGRFLASYQHDGIVYKAPNTFGAIIDAEGWLSDVRRKIDNGTWVDPEAEAREKENSKVTVRQLCEEWLSEADLKESTKQSHARKLQARVLCDSFPGFDSLANVPVVEVDKDRIRDWWSQVQSVPAWKSQKNTNVQAYKRLSTAFRFAVETKKYISESPVKIPGATKLPKPDLRKRKRISDAQAKLLAANISPRLKIGVQLMLWAGLRLGELLELRRSDIEGLNGRGAVVVNISRNAQRVKDEATKKQVMITIDTPKTDAGNRSVTLPPKIAKELRAHAKQYMGPEEDALVITTETGKQMMDTTFRSRFATAKEAAGRPEITPHDCRRFYGTMLVKKAGIPFEDARQLMGHETVEQLMEYVRAEEEYEVQAAKALDKLI
ncbi:Putative prophage phiRv2 integrase [Corynebacterium kalinowskii]|uniref:Prophage phiRv2 integrase n=1 Tax=Corynebacterium kalinowskii TaxID=2675216 RepID=A0A6B8W1U5_9CORY|nr:tyrosine-type recombinase/integrase [Corynebacterium kalinowskii]QGU01618.1 Putative prophage phiRv2 integrase [Corynebacterium kalinowskii]